MRAVDIVQPDICYLGGLTPHAARREDGGGSRPALHAALRQPFHGDHVHACISCGAIGNAGKYLEFSIEGPDYYPWQEGLFRRAPYEVVDGKVTIPDAPGWGVEIDPPGWREPPTRRARSPEPGYGAKVLRQTVSDRARDEPVERVVGRTPDLDTLGEHGATLPVRSTLRLLRSFASSFTSIMPRRSSGLSAAVSVVRSIASSAATDPIVGGSGRFSDIRSENWPLVRPSGRNASSKCRARARAARCVCRHRQWSRI